MEEVKFLLAKELAKEKHDREWYRELFGLPLNLLILPAVFLQINLRLYT